MWQCEQDYKRECKTMLKFRTVVLFTGTGKIPFRLPANLVGRGSQLTESENGMFREGEKRESEEAQRNALLLPCTFLSLLPGRWPDKSTSFATMPRRRSMTGKDRSSPSSYARCVSRYDALSSYLRFMKKMKSGAWASCETS